MKTLDELANKYAYDALRSGEAHDELSSSIFNAFKAGYEAATPKWISVKEGLPEENTKQQVLVAIKDPDGDCYCGIEVWYFNRWEFAGVGEHMHEDGSHITHWMLLPELPKDEK